MLVHIEVDYKAYASIAIIEIQVYIYISFEIYINCFSTILQWEQYISMLKVKCV